MTSKAREADEVIWWAATSLALSIALAVVIDTLRIERRARGDDPGWMMNTASWACTVIGVIAMMSLVGMIAGWW